MVNTELMGSVKEVMEADKVYGLRLVQDGATVRLERVNVKNRFSLPEPTETLFKFESGIHALYRIIKK